MPFGTPRSAISFTFGGCTDTVHHDPMAPSVLVMGHAGFMIAVQHSNWNANRRSKRPLVCRSSVPLENPVPFQSRVSAAAHPTRSCSPKAHLRP